MVVMLAISRIQMLMYGK